MASHANFRIVRVGVPIQEMGLVIRSHDILHGNMNELIQIPAEAAEDRPKAIESVRARQRRPMGITRGPNFTASQLHGRSMH